MNSGKTGGKDCGPVDFDKVMRLASENGVTPFLYRNRETFPDVPQNISEKLKNVYFSTFQSNVRHAAETLRLIRLLQGGGVRAIPLKGSIASDVVFGDLGLYPTNDIDLLVRPSDMEKTGEVLGEAGYHKLSEAAEEDLIRSHYHLTLHNGTYFVELHWNLVKRYFAVSPEFWWEETSTLLYDGTEVVLLSPARYVLYAIFRVYDHAFRPLKFLVLVAGLIHKYREELDWTELLSFAEEYRMKRLVVFTLRLAHDLLGADIPEEFNRTEVRGYNLLKRSVLSGFFHERARVSVRMLLYTLLLTGPWESISIVLQRVFPHISEVRIRYGLPVKSKRAYVYYLLNPFLLLLRRR